MSHRESTAVDQGYRQVITGDGRRLVARLADYERQLWGLLLVALLADVVLTAHGLQAGLQEGNPVMRLAIDTAGIAALLLVKLAVVGFGAAIRRRLGDRGVVVPLGLALPWAGAALINASLLV